MCPANEDRAVPLEVTIPRLAPWIEEPNNFACQRISARQIRPFAQVTAMATPCPIGGIVRTAVLFGDNVFDMECGDRCSQVGETTILAPEIGPFADELAKGLRH